MHAIIQLCTEFYTASYTEFTWEIQALISRQNMNLTSIYIWLCSLGTTAKYYVSVLKYSLLHHDNFLLYAMSLIWLLFKRNNVWLLITQVWL